MALGQVTVSDATFANADWTLNVFPGGNGGSVTATQVTVGSNFLRSISDTVNGTPSIILGTHIYTPFTYTPSTSGPIVTLNYSENAICLSVVSGRDSPPAPRCGRAESSTFTTVS